MRSSQGSEARPFTCAQPVIPGLIARRPRWRGLYCATCAGSVGRGPISDISPRSTFTRFGSSSSEVLRRNAPTRVMRESFASIASPAPTCSAPSTIVRSFSTSNTSPCEPGARLSSR